MRVGTPGPENSMDTKQDKNYRCAEGQSQDEPSSIMGNKPMEGSCVLANELQSVLQETGKQCRKHLSQKLPLSRVRATLTPRPTRPTVSPKILKANPCSNKAELWPLINTTRTVVLLLPFTSNHHVGL